MLPIARVVLLTQLTTQRDFLWSELLSMRVHLMDPELTAQLAALYDW